MLANYLFNFYDNDFLVIKVILLAKRSASETSL